MTGERPWLRYLRASLKLLRRVADNPFVQRSALITGLSLALSGITLAAIGEWAAGGFSSTSADPDPSVTRSSAPNIAAIALPPLPAMPALPEGASYLPADTPGYTFSHDVPEVRLQFAVSDQQGRLVQDLKPADIRILDDQQPVGRLTDFERDDNLPLQLGIMVDTSDSVRRVLPDEKTAASAFLDRVLRPESDTAFVMAFGGTIKVWQGATADRQQLAGAISRLKQPGWGTRFLDALYSACTSQFSGRDRTQQVHRAIVVLSDGDDTDSLRNLAEVVAAAQRSEIQIYGLTISAKKSREDRGDMILQRLTAATGGRVYIAASSKDLDSAFSQIEQDLRTQYYVSFPPQSTQGFHALRVEVPGLRNLEVHARQGYYVQ